MHRLLEMVWSERETLFLIELWIEDIVSKHIWRDAAILARKVYDTMSEVHITIAFCGVISFST